MLYMLCCNVLMIFICILNIFDGKFWFFCILFNGDNICFWKVVWKKINNIEKYECLVVFGWVNCYIIVNICVMMW